MRLKLLDDAMSGEARMHVFAVHRLLFVGRIAALGQDISRQDAGAVRIVTHTCHFIPQACLWVDQALMIPHLQISSNRLSLR